VNDDELIKRLGIAFVIDMAGASDLEWSELLAAAMDARDRLQSLTARVAELEARLEFDPEWGFDGDGISCRDDTIKLQDERLTRLKAANEELVDAMKVIRRKEASGESARELSKIARQALSQQGEKGRCPTKL